MIVLHLKMQLKIVAKTSDENYTIVTEEGLI